MRVGVLALQGTFIEHISVLRQLGVEAPAIRLAHELDALDGLIIRGGFAYGDDISAGRILANQLRLKLRDEIQEFVDDGSLILGICDGFQVLEKAGLLPKSVGEESQLLTIAGNDSVNFE
jgi:phosphoribosylformylglycinamidine (FGAM) synthase-like amidotransferase family enzyme